MSSKIKITRKTKFLTQDQFLLLLDSFISDSYKGIRKKKNGQRIKDSTIQNYIYLKKTIEGFLEKKSFELKLYVENNLTQNERVRAARYYSKFYSAFTNYMYNTEKFFDNYVGLIIKCLRVFFNYLKIERNIPVGSFHLSFFVPIEHPPIRVLTIDQLNYIIYNKEFENLVVEHKLERIKDIFILGCTVALRISDLLKLKRRNLNKVGDKVYLKVKAEKTGVITSIKLPDYAIKILAKYAKGNSKYLLPSISPAWFNTQLKTLAKLFPKDYQIIKTRERKGKPVIIYKDAGKRTHFHFSDLISTHIMRKTAITTMLSLGMPEDLVRKISGHAPNSKEFYRYVEYSQSIIDESTDLVFEKIKSYS